MELKKYILTQEGLSEYEAELKMRRTTKRAEIRDMIKVAKAQGDLSENAEYDAAKNEEASNEARIKELENIVNNAEVADENIGDKDTVNIGCTVRILDIEFNEEMEYRIVGSTEADILKGKISNESPVGSALIGAKKGNEVIADTDAGEIKFKILDVVKSSGKGKS